MSEDLYISNLMVSSVVYIITGNCSWLSLSMMRDGDGPPNRKLCWHGLRDAAIFHAAPCRQQVNICNHNGLCFLTGAKEEDPTSTWAFKMSASFVQFTCTEVCWCQHAAGIACCRMVGIRPRLHCSVVFSDTGVMIVLMLFLGFIRLLCDFEALYVQFHEQGIKISTSIVYLFWLSIPGYLFAQSRHFMLLA